MEGFVNGIDSTMSSIAFNRAALSDLFEALSFGKRMRLALSIRSLKASFSSSDENVIPSENRHLDVAIFTDCYNHVPCNYINSTKDILGAKVKQYV